MKNIKENKYYKYIKPYLNDIKQDYIYMSEKQLAAKYNVSYASWKRYKVIYPEFSEVLAAAKGENIKELKKTLKQKALGYHYTETKETYDKDGNLTKTVTYKKYSLPDVYAINKLLNTLDPTWHNDDQITLDLKRRKLDILEKKVSKDEWESCC